MRSGRLLFVIGTIVALVGAGQASAQTLPEQARTNGGTANSVIDIDGPLPSMHDVVHDSDLVVLGQIVASRTRLNADQTVVETEYTIRPIEAFKDEHPQPAKKPGTVAPIVVRRSGGRLVTEDGLQLGTSANVFPEEECFSVGEEVVVMLSYRADEAVYRFSHGEFAAFRIRDGLVVPMT